MSNEEIVTRIKAGIDGAANMELLYTQNRGMLCKIASKYQSYAEYDDLLQEGFVGLCNAVDAWEPEGGASFIAYAVFWISQAMQRYIENNGSCMRIPSGQQQKIRKYKRTCAQYLKLLGREPADWELCRLLDVSRDALRHIREDAGKSQIRSLNTPLSEDGELSLQDTIPDQRDDYAGVLDKMQQEELGAVLWPMVDSLEERQAKTLRARYQEGKTLKETGEALGCGLQQARSIEAKAMRTLRQPRYADRLRPFLYDEELRSRAMHGTGAEHFRQTWTSATEREALKMYTQGDAVSPPGSKTMSFRRSYWRG